MNAIFRLLIICLVLAMPVISYCQPVWQQAATPSGAGGGIVRTLAVAGNGLFAATANGVHYSPDNGATWIPRNGALLSGRTVHSLASDGPTLFAGVDAIGTNAGLVFKSTDLGITWTDITPAICSSGIARAMVIHNGYVYAGVSGSFYRGVYKSPVSGANAGSWISFNNGFDPPPASTYPDVESLAIMGSSILAGTYGQGVFVSSTTAANWAPLSTGMLPTADYINKLAVNGQHIFAANVSGTPLLYRSTNYGANWTVSGTAIFQDKRVQSLLFHNNRLYAGVTHIGVFVSDDNGVSWSAYVDGLTNSSGFACNGNVDVHALIVKDSTLFLGAYGCGVWKRSLASTPYNTISGSAFFDINSNGIKEATETLYRPITVQLIHGADTSSVINPFGYFTSYVDTGTYKSRVIPSSPYHTATPVMESSSFATYNNVDTVVFAVQPVPGKRDMSVGLIPMGPARPGFPVNYKLVYGNKGTDTSDVTIQLVKSNKLNYHSASVTPAYSNADTLRWNIPALKPLQVGEINVALTLQPPPGVNFNDTLVSVATISSNAVDLAPIDNTSCLRQRVTGSYDPNDKKEIHDGRMLRSAISDGEKLQYTIRFQNTGNDTAFNIAIKDTLSAKLDWNSLEMISASHDYQLTMNNGICSWQFNNIQLVDSNNNEPLSHGYLSFKIAARSSVVAGDVIQNRASIYFDYNLPVVTNTETTAVITQVYPVKLLLFTATKQPGGNVLKWTVENQINFSRFEVERSENGIDFKRIAAVPGGPSEFSFTDNSFSRSLNYYRLKLVDLDGKYSYSAVERVNNKSDIDVTLYPNPVKDVLLLRVASANARVLEVRVIGYDGSVALSRKFNVAAGANVKPFPMATLVAGSYLLWVSSGDEAPFVLRFQKQ